MDTYHTSGQESVGQELYSGVAGIGRIGAIVGAIFATIVGALFIAGGIFNLTQTENMSGGWILIAIGILIIVLSWFWVYLTNRYKFLAAVGGADTLIRDI